MPQVLIVNVCECGEMERDRERQHSTNVARLRMQKALKAFEWQQLKVQSDVAIIFGTSTLKNLACQFITLFEPEPWQI